MPGLEAGATIQELLRRSEARSPNSKKEIALPGLVTEGAYLRPKRETVGHHDQGWLTGNRNRVDHETGAFSEYLITKANVQIKVPDNLSFEEAATLGVATFTCVGYAHARML